MPAVGCSEAGRYRLTSEEHCRQVKQSKLEKVFGMPQVSVVIPVYNASKFLRETLGHVFAQTFKDYEVIVVDDGSTDNSVGVVEEMAEQYARTVRIIRQANRGAAAARNTGARVAQGQYLAFLDADDIWYPQKLDREVEVLTKDQAAIMVWSNYDVVDGIGRLVRFGSVAHQLTRYDDSPLTKLLGQETRCVHLSAMLVRRTVFEQIGGFDPDVFPVEDYDTAFRLFNFGRCVFLKENLAAYRNHSEGVSKVGLMHGSEMFLRKLERIYADDVVKRRLVYVLLGDLYSDWGWQEISAGRCSEGRRRLIQSLGCNPSKFRTYSRLVRSWLPEAMRSLLF